MSMIKRTKKSGEKRRGAVVSVVLIRIGITAAVTLLLLIIALYGVMLILTRGPSETTKRLFVMTVKETSAGGFLAHMCLSSDEIDEIMSVKLSAADQTGGNITDKNLISLPENDSISGNTGISDETNENAINTVADESGANAPVITEIGEGESNETVLPGGKPSDMNDGIEIKEIKGDTYNGVMMIIHDPKRVFIGVPDKYGDDAEGLSLKSLIEKYGARGGTNAGGFIDIGGMGNGGKPLGPVIKDGEIIWGDAEKTYSMIGFDSDGILHVGTMSCNSAIAAGVKEAVCFGPALIINGTPCNSAGILSGGLNPRTAIGQRGDGAVMLLVVNGRSIGSLGATLDDLVDIMMSNDAVNASNLDGGASSLMMYDGETMNNSAYVYGERILPNAILVR